MKLRAHLVACLVGATLLLTQRAQAQETTLPASIHAPLLVRALAYDRNLSQRAGNSVTLAVLVNTADSGSADDARESLEAFRKLERYKVVGLPFQVVRIDFTKAAALKATIKEQGIDALYVCAGLETHLDAIAAIARELSIVTLTSQRAYVFKELALAVAVVGNKPTLLLNPSAARSEGSDFSAPFMKIATLTE